MWRQHHDELAGFMAAMAPDGAAQAVNLTGLTLKGEMDMALRIGQYRCVQLCSVHFVIWLARHWTVRTRTLCVCLKMFDCYLSNITLNGISIAKKLFS